ncbi:hypothetical protein B484DRAFT_321249, partial [Ochromonadaceae sp. CCMP2298]
VTLHRDTAAWCPYCEKVWLLLEEKRIPYFVKKVPLSCYGKKPQSFLTINPQGGLPVAVIDGRVMAESNDILFFLDKAFPSPQHPPMLQGGQGEIQALMQLERQAFSVWFRWLTSSGDQSQQMRNVLNKVDRALADASSQGPYFQGRFSMVDILFTPFLERMAASLPYYKGKSFEVRCADFPHLLKWYQAMDARPAYIGLKSDYYTHVHDLPPQIGGCVKDGAGAAYRGRIDGGDWRVEVAGGGCFEPMMPEDPQEACREVGVGVGVGMFYVYVCFICCMLYMLYYMSLLTPTPLSTHLFSDTYCTYYVLYVLHSGGAQPALQPRRSLPLQQ